jgi:hypothetical protein
MKVFAVFLVASFLLGGTSLNRFPLHRPAIWYAGCVVVAVSFLSMRVIQ